jgi:hypothetical protein
MMKQLFSWQNANTLMLDVAGKEYVTKEEEEPEDEAGPDTEDQPQEDQEDEEEEVVMSLGGGGDYAELMKKMDIIPCTVIVPKVRIQSRLEGPQQNYLKEVLLFL